MPACWHCAIAAGTLSHTHTHTHTHCGHTTSVLGRHEETATWRSPVIYSAAAEEEEEEEEEEAKFILPRKQSAMCYSLMQV